MAAIDWVEVAEKTQLGLAGEKSPSAIEVLSQAVLIGALAIAQELRRSHSLLSGLELDTKKVEDKQRQIRFEGQRGRLGRMPGRG